MHGALLFAESNSPTLIHLILFAESTVYNNCEIEYGGGVGGDDDYK